MISGLLNLPWWGVLIAALVMTHISVVGVSMYLHRSQAHRSLHLHPIVSHFFRFWLWLTTATNTCEWVAVHRKHHAKVEMSEDPHSPQIMGIKKILFEGGEVYNQARKDTTIISEYGQGTPDDWIEHQLYGRYKYSGILIMLIIDLLLFGVLGLSVWAFQMIFMPFFAGGVINGIGHYWGYRNFECPDASRNIIPLGLFLGGEELHNNHHCFGTSAKFSVKWWEFDISWFYIRLLGLLRLAKPRPMPPKLLTNPLKTTLDKEAVLAVVMHRFRVLDRYYRKVIVPVLREEKMKAGKKSRHLFRRARVLLRRETTLVKPTQRQRLEQLLSSQMNLKVVYDFRLKLQKIWQRQHNQPQADLLQQLQDWCQQAEQTGIAALHRFADQVRMYSLKQQRQRIS